MITSISFANLKENFRKHNVINTTIVVLALALITTGSLAFIDSHYIPVNTIGAGLLTGFGGGSIILGLFILSRKSDKGKVIGVFTRNTGQDNPDLMNIDDVLKNYPLEEDQWIYITVDGRDVLTRCLSDSNGGIKYITYEREQDFPPHKRVMFRYYDSTKTYKWSA